MSVPLRLALDKFISKRVVLVVSQTTASQLQRLVWLVSDHELRGDGKGRGEDRLFFHLTRASASVFSDEVIFNGSKDISSI
jgi:hypothetical protein